MKKIYYLLPILTLFLISCYGPPGPPGPPGQDGDGLIGRVFEVTANFNAANNFEYFTNIPDNITVYDSDVVQAYILAGVNNGVDVWEPLPQTLFFGDDVFLYGYNYTKNDVIFFLDGTVNFMGLDSSYRDNVVFRVAVIPADFAKEINVRNYNEVFRFVEKDDIILLD